MGHLPEGASRQEERNRGPHLRRTLIVKRGVILITVGVIFVKEDQGQSHRF